MVSTPALEAARSKLVNRRRERQSKFKTRSSKPDLIKIKDDPIHLDTIHPNHLYDFLKRLSTFKLSNYPAGKPRSLSPSTLASFGWISVSGTKNRLKCESCQATWVLACPSTKSDSGWSSTSGVRLTQLGCKMRVEEHRNSCPWRKRRCAPTIYTSALRCSGGFEAASELLETAAALEQLLAEETTQTTALNTEHPLPQAAIDTLLLASKILNSRTPQSNPRVTSVLTLILALFGWHPDSIESHLSAAPSRPGTPAPQSSSHGRPSSSLSSRTLSCKLCHRQIGLWSILVSPSPEAVDPTQRRPPTNLLTSHRDYCPYRDELGGFDRSDYETFELTLPQPTWKSHLSLIERYVERYQQASQAAAEPNCLENLIKLFKDSHNLNRLSSEGSMRSYPELHRILHSSTSRSDTQIWALGFVKGTLSKCAAMG
ncbi:C3HC zinc finger-like-domain-containing protein [Melampsora americana]|nr:C3HC zinc finger-like-domain-containing protein [Melampsora americana]